MNTQKPLVLSCLFWLCGFLLCLGCEMAVAAVDPFDAVVLHPAIPLLDENGRHVLESGQPYSSRMSCGNGSGSGCHDYRKISSGYHFEQGRDEARDDFGAAHGLPQLVSPGYFGGYNCMGGNNPGWLARKNANVSEVTEFGDYGAAGLVKACADCHAGGGWSEHDRQGQRYDTARVENIPLLDGDYFDRRGTRVDRWDWYKSGVMENDCMMCHADLGSMNVLHKKEGKTVPTVSQWLNLRNEQWARQGAFRAIDSAIWGYLNLRPKQPGGFFLMNYVRESNAVTAPARLENGQPILQWNRKAFNAMGKIALPMRRFPASDNCMVCHVTSSDRRGFYGFGAVATPSRNPDKISPTAHKQDVHKGKYFTEDNGETRTLNNCNGCHAKRYYEPRFTNVALDADHHFPKGNGDADVRNDLDTLPGAKSCEHCHDIAKNPALPSGQKNILDAHLQLWRGNGDLDGYAASTLVKITQSHLDTLACQTCHINQLKDSKGQALTLHFRYRLGDDRKLKVFPYHPSFRYFIQDRSSGRVLYQHEREAVIARETDADGKVHARIIDPLTRQKTGQLTLTADGNPEPDSYADFKALKQAYDQLLKSKGYSAADTRFVYVEANRYVISHNTRPAVQATVCAECHGRAANGSFSSGLAPEGLLGKTRTIEMTRLPDRRLVDEGIVEFTTPYTQVDDKGRVLERVGDVLYASRFDPSMTALNTETTRSISGLFKTLKADEAAALLGVNSEVAARLTATLNDSEWLLFNSRVGHASLRDVALIATGSPLNQTLLSEVRLQVDSRAVDVQDQKRLAGQVAGIFSGDIYRVSLSDATGISLTDFAGREALMLLPYIGKATNPNAIRVVYSEDGTTWNTLAKSELLALQPRQQGDKGLLVVRIHQPYRHLAIMEKSG